MRITDYAAVWDIEHKTWTWPFTSKRLPGGRSISLRAQVAFIVVPLYLIVLPTVFPVLGYLPLTPTPWWFAWPFAGFCALLVTTRAIDGRKPEHFARSMISFARRKLRGSDPNPLRIKHMRGNVIIDGRGDKAALYQLELEPGNDPKGQAQRIAHILHKLERDFWLWRVNRYLSPEDYVKQAEPFFAKGDPKRWRPFLAEHAKKLEELKSFRPEVYLAVPLQGRRDLRAHVERLRSSVSRAPGEGPGRGDDFIAKREAEIRRLIESRTKARPASPMDVQWLIRRCAVRGVCEPQLDEHWSPLAHVRNGKVRPVVELWKRLANAPIDERVRMLRVDGEEQRSFQAMLAFCSLPEGDLGDKDLALFSKQPEDLDFPLDLFMYGRCWSNKRALKRIRNRVTDAKNQRDDEQGDDEREDTSIEAQERVPQARKLEHYLVKTKAPMYEVAMFAAAGAASPEQLIERIDATRAAYGDIKLERPMGAQRALYGDSLPSVTPSEELIQYLRPMTVEQIGSLGVLSADVAGSAAGIMTQRTVAGNRPVLWAPFEGSSRGRPTTELEGGTNGGGKTVMSLTKAAIVGLMSEAVVTLDCAQKRSHHLDRVPELNGLVEVLDVGSPEAAGAFDPLRYAPEDGAVDVAASYVNAVLPRNIPPEWTTQILAAVMSAADEPTPRLARIIPILRARGHAAVADAIEVRARKGLPLLAFGDYSGGVSKQILTIWAPNLPLPAQGQPRREWEESERLAVATMGLAAMRAMAMLQNGGLFVATEAWALLESDIGLTLLNYPAHSGRGAKIRLIFDTQIIRVLGKFASLIGSGDLFNIESVEDAKAGLTLWGRSPDDLDAIRKLRAYRKGRCLHRDLDDRVVECQGEPGYLLPYLRTEPEEIREEVAA